MFWLLAINVLAAMTAAATCISMWLSRNHWRRMYYISESDLKFYKRLASIKPNAESTSEDNK